MTTNTCSLLAHINSPFWELFVNCLIESAWTADRVHLSFRKRICWRKFGIHLSFWENG